MGRSGHTKSSWTAIARLAFKNGGKVHLRSRNDNDFNARYPGIVKALAPLPKDTLIDGEVVALDDDGKPSFNMLQNYGSAGAYRCTSSYSTCWC